MKKSRLLIFLIAAAPVLLVALCYGRLPDTVPTSWRLDGEVVYSQKSALWLISGLSPLLALLFFLLPRIDPRASNYRRFSRYYDSFVLLVELFLLVMVGIIVSESFSPGKISVAHTVTVLLGLLFVFIGNLLPKIKSNFFLGIRTPWTLSDTTVWHKTHRLAGALFFVCGLLMMTLGFIFESQRVMMTLVLLLVLLSAAVPTAASCFWYRAQHPSQTARQARHRK